MQKQVASKHSFRRYVSNMFKSKNKTMVDNRPIIKKALMIGINYRGSDHELNGCINDVENLKHFFIQHEYIKKEDIDVMTDDSNGTLYPTRRNIIAMLENMVIFAKKNSDKQVQLILSYSGHGYYMADDNSDESDGRDEMLCPIDWSTNGYIKDDYLKKNFSDLFQENVTLFSLIDCCHSGTMLDLKYNYKYDRNRLISTKYQIDDSRATIMMISGCRDYQTSKDSYLYDSVDNTYEYQGAMTAAFIGVYYHGITFRNLMTKIKHNLKNAHFSQLPQLSTGQEINVDKQIYLCAFKNK